MARLIVKSPYIKCGGGRSAGGYMRYIATRERVELIQDDRPPTRKQEQLIAKLVKDFPAAKELDEYDDYQEHPTKANASAFISQALEEIWSDVQISDGYMKYIATRPRAERLGSHGLFGGTDGVELDMLSGIIADSFQFSEEDLRRRRAESVRNVKQTNGRISFEKRVRESVKDDDGWQG